MELYENVNINCTFIVHHFDKVLEHTKLNVRNFKPIRDVSSILYINLPISHPYYCVNIPDPTGTCFVYDLKMKDDISNVILDFLSAARLHGFPSSMMLHLACLKLGCLSVSHF